MSQTRPILLGFNVDHVATLRQARGERYPDPVHAAMVAEQAGADGITMHLREDRRHIQDEDVFRYAACARTRLNLEMAATEEMTEIALKALPRHCCLVPEKREELTTEGGLDVRGGFDRIAHITQRLQASGIDVSLFIDPDPEQVRASRETGASTIELHTGRYAEHFQRPAGDAELQRLEEQAAAADAAGMIVNAGHGLTQHNVGPIASIPVIHELNIGHAIVADAVLLGLPAAIRQMRERMIEARRG